jgi:hypothetical protein
MNNLNVCSTHSYLYHGPSLYTDGHNQQPEKHEHLLWRTWNKMKKVDGNLGSGFGHVQICSSYKLFNELLTKMW